MGQKARYEFLDHTADAKFRAYGDTLEEAVSNAALALASLIWDGRLLGKPESRTVEIEGRSLEQLVVHTLDEIIYLLETEGFLLAEASNAKISRGPDESWRLKAVFQGEHISDKHGLRSGAKAVTYNELEIKRDGEVTIQVVVDV